MLCSATVVKKGPDLLQTYSLAVTNLLCRRTLVEDAAMTKLVQRPSCCCQPIRTSQNILVTRRLSAGMAEVQPVRLPREIPRTSLLPASFPVARVRERADRKYF